MKKIVEKNSFGVLLYHGEKERRKYLIIQNRDSEAFIYFFLSWNMNRWTDQYLCKVLRGFSRDELNRLLFYPFDVLYTDLYVNHQKGTFQKQYERAKANYDYFHSRPDWIALSLNCPTTEIFWGFPKGRIEPNETPHQCALRELMEETDISPDNVVFDTNAMPLTYMNHKHLFKTIVHVALFPAECKDLSCIRYKTFQNTIRCVSISNEVLHARWVNAQEASLFLPLHLQKLLYEFHLNS